MNKDLHNIDDLFKKALEEHQDLPSDQVWENIDKSLDKRKVISISKKYNTLKWAAAFLLLFSVGMGMYTLHMHSRNSELVKQNNTEKKIKNKQPGTNTALKDDSNFTTSTNSINEKASSKNKMDDYRNDAGKKNIKAGKSLSMGNRKENNIDLVKKDVREQQTADAVDSQQRNIGDDQQDTSHKTSQHKASISLALMKKENQSNYFPAKNNIEPTENINNGDDANNKNSEQNLKQELASPGKSYLNKLPFIAMQNEMDGTGKIETSSLVLKMELGAEAAIQNSVSKNNLSIPKLTHLRKAKTSLFSLTAFFSPDVVSSDLRDNHSRFGEDDRNKIEREEKFKFSSTVGLLVDYNIAKKWKIESGLTYSTRVTNIQAKTIYARPDDHGNINYRFNCSAGYSFVTLDATPPPISGDSIMTLPSSNTLHYIGVPLVIKYVFTSRRFSLLPGVGIAANFLTQGKLQTAVATATGNKTASSNTIQGLKSTYFNGSATLGAQYKLNGALELTFVPTVRFALSAINRDAPVKTNENSFGFAGGVIFNF